MKQASNLWIIHVLGWLLIISLPLTIMSRDTEPGIELSLLASWSFWLFFLLYFSIFYFNVLFLIPRLFLRQKYLLYALVFAAGLVVIFISQPFEKLIFQKFRQEQRHFTENTMPPPPPGEFRPNAPPPGRNMPRPVAVDFVSLILFIVICVIGIATKLSEQWQLSEKRAIRSEADKAQAELSFFKAQINPHFLFNTLNNIYSLAVSQSTNTAPSILKLSEMLRYITEEATADFVPMEDEIACLTNYIDLQKLRLSAKTNVDFSVTGSAEHLKIAPLILMTFVENAFKYGVSNHNQTTIVIRIEMSEAGIGFFCENRIFVQAAQPVRAGVGIANTKKRLAFLYPDQHELSVADDGQTFSVKLKLDIK